MIYIFVFTFCFFLFYLSDKIRSFSRFFFSLSAIILLCMFAALRNNSVGTDITNYGISTFQSAESNNLAEHIYFLRNSYAPLFSIVTWIGVHLTGSFNGMLFIIQLLSIVPFYYISKKEIGNHIAVCMLIYMLLLFPITLNLLKQGIAISYAYVAGVYAYKTRWKLFALFSIIAIGFHLTGIFCILYMFLVLFLKKKKIFKKNRLKLLLLTISIIYMCVLYFGRDIVRLIAPLRDSYAYQLNAIGKGSLNISMLIMLAVYILLGIYCYNKMTVFSDSALVYYYILSVVGLALTQFDIITESLSRISYYGMIFIPLCFIKMYRKGNFVVKILLAFIIFMYFAVFVYSNIIMGYQAIYPYHSDILKM